MDNEVELLNIDKDRIIHILLKQLMYIKNECAYVKNMAGLNNSDYSNRKKDKGIINGDLSKGKESIGIINGDLSKGKESIGIINGDLSKGKESVGIINGDLSKGKESIGIINGDLSKGKESVGIINGDLSKGKESIGINNGDLSKENKDIGIINGDLPKENKYIGINALEEALSALDGSENAVNMLYSAFEQELITALEQYIKDGNGQNTLYNYYSDFENAVAETNLAASKIEEAATTIVLEDTHILPAEILADEIAIGKLMWALHGTLPHNSKQEMYKNAAHELLFLHNKGMAKQTPLRKSAGISVSGFAKHLPKMIGYGLIKELPAKNYGLTENAKHILLKTFGIEKNK